MGSFNVACTVSRVSIGCGDPVVYLPLEKYKYASDFSATGNNMLIYPHCIYSPVALPIFGEYDDYGGIKNIERTKVVELAEKHFGVSIDKICSIDSMPKPVSSGMFVHREVFDHLVNNTFDEWGSNTSDWVSTKKTVAADLDKAIQRATKVKKDWEKLMEMSTAIGNDGDQVDSYMITQALLEYGLSFRNYETFNNIYRAPMLGGEIRDEIIEFRLFDSAMFGCNVFYFPAMNGFQCGNHYMSRELYKVSSRIVKRRIKEDERAREDDE